MYKLATVVLILSMLLASAMGQATHTGLSKQPTLTELVARSSGAVVQIIVSDRAGTQISLGSGFIVTADGKIVTNYHVIKDAHSAVAELSNGSFFPVQGVMAVDKDRDLAILKVERKNLSFLKIAPHFDLQVGDHVVAIGSPLGLEGTVSDGIVSALREEELGKRWIQTTAPVSHGNSGGPLLNMEGNVVGVITWGVNTQEGQNLNFALPSDVLMTLISKTHEPLSFDDLNTGEPSTPATGEKGGADGNRDLALSLYKEGSAALEAKQYEQAIHDFQESVRLNPEDGNAWHDLGLAHMFSDQYEECLADFKEAVKRDPQNRYFWSSVGTAYAIFKKYDDALSAYQEAIGIDPTYAQGWYDLGDTYAHLRNYDQAVRAYKQATVLNGAYSKAWYELGATLNVLERYDDAVEALKRAVELNPADTDAWFFLGSSYDSMKRYEDAIAAWKKEADLQPTDASVLGEIGSAYVNLNDLKDAEDFLLKAVEAKKASGHMTNVDISKICLYWNELADIYDKQRKHRQADYYWKAARDLQNTYSSPH